MFDIVFFLIDYFFFVQIGDYKMELIRQQIVSIFYFFFDGGIFFIHHGF